MRSVGRSARILPRASSMQSWPKSEGGWQKQLSKSQLVALSKAKKAAKDAEMAAEAAEAALKLAAKSKGKGKSTGKAAGKGGKAGGKRDSTGDKITGGHWLCQDPDCLADLHKHSKDKKRGPFSNPSTAKVCAHCLAPKDMGAQMKHAEREAARSTLRELVAAKAAKEASGYQGAAPPPPDLAAQAKANKGVITLHTSESELVASQVAPVTTPPHIQAAAAPSAPGEEEAASATARKQHRRPITLDAKLWEDIPAVQPVVDALLASMAFDLMPTEAPLKKADEWLAELLGGQPACQHSARRTTVAAQLEGAQSALTSLAGKDPDLAKAIHARITTLTAELEAIDRKLPSQKKCAASITAAKKEFNDRHATALEACQRAKAAHVERRTGRRQLTQRAREVMDLLDAEMEKEEMQYEEAHGARNTRREEIALEVTTLLDSRLEQAEAEMETDAPTPAPQQTTAMMQPSLVDQGVMTRLKNQLDAARQYNAILTQFHRRAPELLELPQLSPANVDAMRPALVHLHFFLQKWAAEGGGTPFRLGDLPFLDGATVTTPTVLKEALGDKWHVFFPDSDEINAMTTVPPKQPSWWPKRWKSWTATWQRHLQRQQQRKART